MAVPKMVESRLISKSVDWEFFQEGQTDESKRKRKSLQADYERYIEEYEVNMVRKTTKELHNELYSVAKTWKEELRVNGRLAEPHRHWLGQEPHGYKDPRPIQAALFDICSRDYEHPQSWLQTPPGGSGKSLMTAHEGIVDALRRSVSKIFVVAPFQVHVLNLMKDFCEAAAGTDVVLCFPKHLWNMIQRETGDKFDVKRVKVDGRNEQMERQMQMLRRLQQVRNPAAGKIPREWRLRAITATPGKLMDNDIRLAYKLNSAGADNYFLVQTNCIEGPRLQMLELEDSWHS